MSEHVSGLPHSPGFATRAIAHEAADPEIPSHAVALPIAQTASFAFDTMDDLSVAIHDPEHAHVYSRLSNPTVEALERTIASLESTEAGLAFASGMAAIHATAVTVCRAGDHIVAPASLYGGTLSLFRDQLSRFGIETTFVPNGDLAAAADAMRPTTKLVWAETISNPTIAVADLPALAELAHDSGALFVVDSTFATPYLCRPREHGADLVVHSASKYLGGHGDLVGGVLAGPLELVKQVRRTSIDVGGTMAPFVAWLVLRGLKTLALRMERHSRSALRVAEHLAEHPRVKRVRYPGLPGHLDHVTASRLLPLGQSGMLAFEVDVPRDELAERLERLELILRAPSLGDARSLIIHPATTTHRQLTQLELLQAGISDTFVRLSVGLEDVEDLIADLELALR